MLTKKSISYFLFVLVISSLYPQNSQANFGEITLAATGDGRVATVLLPKHEVEKLLPADFELGDAPQVDPNYHPVSILFVTQKDFYWLQGKDKYKLTDMYKEIIFAVHYVKQKGKDKLYWYFDSLFLDSIPAVVGGWYFGYPKLTGHFIFEPHTNYAIDYKNDVLSKLKFTKKQNYNRSQLLKNFEFVKKQLNTPVIAKRLGQTVCSQFSWDFDTAEVAPIKGRISILPDYYPAFSYTQTLKGLDESIYGSYAIKSSWVLKGPFACD